MGVAVFLLKIIFHYEDVNLLLYTLLLTRHALI